jgi:hypothetical protein
MKMAEKLGNSDKRVLVATPCLAEGVNLQHLFSAVVIYDLSWNPNNHEQAFGRVDRFGQTKPEVRVAVVAGDGHPVDDHVLRVLYDKNNILRESLGVSHFVPDLSDMVGNFLDREIKGETQPEMFETELRLTWSDARDRENRVRTLFAQVSQETMKYLEVFTSEIVQARAALGGTDLPERLFTAACTALGVQIAQGAVAGTLTVRPQGMPVPVREDLGLLGPGQTVVDSFTVAFDEGKHADHRLHRTHDMVQRLASHLAERALATGWLVVDKEQRKGKRRGHEYLVTEPVRQALAKLLELQQELRPMCIDGGLQPPLLWGRLVAEGGVWRCASMSVRSFQARIKHWAELAGLPVGVSPHWLRHTRGVNIIERSRGKNPLKVAQLALGHVSIASTGIYTQMSRQAYEQELHAVAGGRMRKADARAAAQGGVR